MPEAVADRATVYRLAIPLRRPLELARGERTHAEPIIVAVELRDGTVGWGEASSPWREAHESGESVAARIRDVYVPALASFHATNFAEALEQIDAIPWHDAHERPMPFARAAVELALLDASMKRFDRTIDDAVRWMDLPGYGRPGSLPGIRFSAVIDTTDRSRMRRLLRSYRWRRFRDFKLTVGFAGDRDLVHDALRSLGPSIRARRRTLRLEANSAWDLSQAEAFLSGVNTSMLAGIEQPLPRGREADLVGLSQKFRVPIIHDESLQSEDDARRLAELGVADVVSVGIAKCGGLLPALRIAHVGARSGVRIQLGAGALETGILAGAGMALLDVCPVAAAEGCLGRRVLRADLFRRARQFGLAGRPPALRGSWSSGLEDSALLRWLCEPPERHVL